MYRACTNLFPCTEHVYLQPFVNVDYDHLESFAGLMYDLWFLYTPIKVNSVLILLLRANSF